MNENDGRAGDAKIFGIAVRRLTLIRMAGAAFAVTGLLDLAEAFLRNDSIVWWKVVLGFALLAFGCMFLTARPAGKEI